MSRLVAPWQSWAPLAGLVLLALVAVLFFQRVRQEERFCAICGKRASLDGWHLRGTDWTFALRHRESDTELSTLLSRKQLVAEHRHTWVAPTTVPDPLDATRPPVVESVGLLNTPRITGFLGNLADYADPISRRQWIAQSLRPETTYLLDDALRFFKLPPGGFSARGQFVAWWGQNAFPLANRLREQTEAD